MNNFLFTCVLTATFFCWRLFRCLPPLLCGDRVPLTLPVSWRRNGRISYLGGVCHGVA